jgi:hypothetical protein
MTVPLFAFGMPVLQIFDFQSAKLGCHATGCHIGFMGLYYQITHEKLLQFFCVCYVPTTGLVDQESIQNGYVCQMEKHLLGPLPCSPSNSLAVDHPV